MILSLKFIKFVFAQGLVLLQEIEASGGPVAPAGLHAATHGATPSHREKEREERQRRVRAPVPRRERWAARVRAGTFVWT